MGNTKTLMDFLTILSFIKEIFAPIGTLIALIASGILVYRSFKTLPKELKKTDVELSAMYNVLAKDSLEAANFAREERNKYRTELEGCCGKLDAQEQRITALEIVVARKDAYIAYLTNGVKKLCAQMRRKSIIPLWEPLDEEEFEENQ